MSGSRLGRGRSGRTAVYGGCGVVIILLVFLYRAATSEMARLRDSDDIDDSPSWILSMSKTQEIVALFAIVSSNTMRTIPALKLETSTKSNSNIDSVSSNRAVKYASKVKIPAGVLPILMIMEQNTAEKIDSIDKTNEKLLKNDVSVVQSDMAMKKKKKDVILSEVNSKEKGNEVNNNDNANNVDDPPYKSLSVNKHGVDQIVGGVKQQNGGDWFKVKPGVQELGEELNLIDRLPRLDSIVDRQFGLGEE